MLTGIKYADRPARRKVLRDVNRLGIGIEMKAESRPERLVEVPRNGVGERFVAKNTADDQTPPPTLVGRVAEDHPDLLYRARFDPQRDDIDARAGHRCAH